MNEMNGIGSSILFCSDYLVDILACCLCFYVQCFHWQITVAMISLSVALVSIISHDNSRRLLTSCLYMYRLIDRNANNACLCRSSHFSPHLPSAFMICQIIAMKNAKTILSLCSMIERENAIAISKLSHPEGQEMSNSSLFRGPSFPHKVKTEPL